MFVLLYVLNRGVVYCSLMLTSVNSEMFARIFIVPNNLKRHICDVKNSRQEHDLPTSVNGRMISRN